MIQEALDRLARRVPRVLLELRAPQDLQAQRALRESQVRQDLLELQEASERLDQLVPRAPQAL